MIVQRVMIDDRGIVEEPKEVVVLRLAVDEYILVELIEESLFRSVSGSRRSLTRVILFNRRTGRIMPMVHDCTLCQRSLFTARADPMASGSGSMVMRMLSLVLNRE